MFASLLHFRLRWYALSTARLLLRRWQAWLLALGVLAPAGASILGNLQALGYPLLLSLAPEHGLGWRFGYLLSLQAFALLWFVMQRAQIDGGGLMRFAGSLPLPQRATRALDVLVLALADSPLWLPLGAALLVVGARAGAGSALKAANVLFLLDFALLVLLAQLAALERRPLAWIVVAALSLLNAASVGSAWQLGACALSAVAAGTLLTLPLPHGGAGTRAALWRALARFDAALPALAARLPAPGLIALGVLLRQRRAETIGKALAAAAIGLVALVLMRVWDYDARAFPLLVMAQSATALAFSGLYRGLQMAHRAAAPYFDALPLGRAWWRLAETAALTALGLPFFALAAGVALAHRAAPAGAALASVLSACALLCVLRAPQLYRERHAVFLSTVAAVAWCALTIALLV